MHNRNLKQKTASTLQSQDQLDVAVYNFMQLSKHTSHFGVTVACIAHNLDLTHNQVFSSLKRLNNRGVKVIRLFKNAKV